MNSFIYSTIESSKQTASNLLSDFIGRSDLSSDLITAFGDSLDTDKGYNILESLAQNNFDSLNIEVRPSREINNAQGAYVLGSNTVYLSEEFVTENIDNPDAIANARANDEVWVAAGNYKPTTDGDRDISFNITEFVQFYGGFAGNETEQEGTIPLYRFYNPVIDAHFYTPLAAERDFVTETLPDYQLEGESGVTFYVEPL